MVGQQQQEQHPMSMNQVHKTNNMRISNERAGNRQREKYTLDLG